MNKWKKEVTFEKIIRESRNTKLWFMYCKFCYLLFVVFTIITLFTLFRWVFFILVHYVYRCLITFVIIITEWIWCRVSSIPVWFQHIINNLPSIILWIKPPVEFFPSVFFHIIATNCVRVIWFPSDFTHGGRETQLIFFKLASDFPPFRPLTRMNDLYLASLLSGVLEPYN